MREAVRSYVYLLFTRLALWVTGGPKDLACYKITGQVAQNGNLEIAEMCARSGANCGSLFLDLRFRELVKTLLVDHPAHLDAASLAYFMHSFSQTDKLAYQGEVDDGRGLLHEDVSSK